MLTWNTLSSLESYYPSPSVMSVFPALPFHVCPWLQRVREGKTEGRLLEAVMRVCVYYDIAPTHPHPHITPPYTHYCIYCYYYYHYHYNCCCYYGVECISQEQEFLISEEISLSRTHHPRPTDTEQPMSHCHSEARPRVFSIFIPQPGDSSRSRSRFAAAVRPAQHVRPRGHC